MSTFNGALYLHDQLESLLHQTHADWVLYWRDDGSSDATLNIMTEFAAGAGQGRCVQVPGPPRNLGPAASFHLLLRFVATNLEPNTVVAFADQDDVWLPNKLRRGWAALSKTKYDLPLIYCARQILVGPGLNRIGESTLDLRHSGFPSSLIQNVATGCTVMLNGPAVRLVAASEPPAVTMHDWWCYLIVTAGGGRLLHDQEPVILYRQHAGNLMGAPVSLLNRGAAALWRGPRPFMSTLRQNVAALLAQPQLLTDQACGLVVRLDETLRSGVLCRLRAIWTPAFVRQTWIETVVFRYWFIFY